MPTLYLVGLPIGNKDDLTFRVRDALEKGLNFLAEDTRTFISFLQILGIDSKSKNILAYHDFSPEKVYQAVEKIFNRGEDIYLVSEAGSPVISDPAYPLVRFILGRDIKLETLPGITSPLVALELSGLPPHPFTFHGFWPRDKEKKIQALENISKQTGTHIIMESPYRMEATLQSFCERFPQADFAVCRELTKKFQTVYRFSGSQLAEENINFKGECVLVVHLKKERKDLNLKKLEKLAEDILEGEKGQKKTLAKLLGEILDEDPKKIYHNLVNLTRRA